MCAVAPLASTTSAKTSAFCAASQRGPSRDSKATVLGIGVGAPTPGKASPPVGAAAPAGPERGAVAQAGVSAAATANDVARLAARATISGSKGLPWEENNVREGEGMG